MQDERRKRQHERTRLGGSVRLLIDTPDGLRTAGGQIIDLSAGGCAICLHRSVQAQLVGRVHVEIAGKAIWLPVVTRWVRADARGWIVGCAFDRLTDDKQRAVRALLAERRRVTA
jgi:hypothetical protein